MEQRVLGQTGRPVSVIGLGTWQLGADWGSVSEADAPAVLRAAAESGVTFFDTADVYGDGRSEQVIGRFLAEDAGRDIMVATKMGRRVDQQPENYTLANFRAWTDRSRANLGVDRLDLVQLHCPPTPVFSYDAVFDALDTLVAEERIATYGVSVETSDQALAAIARPGVATVQIILNAFRRKPLERCCPRRRRPGPASSPGSRWRPGCCPAATRWTPRSPPTTTAPSTGTARRSTSARPSPGSTTRPASGRRRSSPPSWPSPALTPRRRAGRRRPAVHRPGRAPLGHPAARGHHGHPGRAQPRAGPAERRRRRAPAAHRDALSQIEELYDKDLRAQVHSRW